MPRCNKIFIVGFSGAGKSTLLQSLQDEGPESWKFYDSDREILSDYPQFKQLSDLIGELGWEKFRLLEEEKIKKFVASDKKGIMSLGGGAFTKKIWEEYRNKDGILFCYLKADFDECWERLIKDGGEPRPLTKKGRDYFSKLFEERRQLYEKIPWVLINNSGTSIEDLALKFWDEIQ